MAGGNISSTIPADFVASLVCVMSGFRRRPPNQHRRPYAPFERAPATVAIPLTADIRLRRNIRRYGPRLCEKGFISAPIFARRRFCDHGTPICAELTP